MANPPPTPNPYIWESPDNEGEVIRITTTWNTTTRAITGITVFRDVACAWTRILIGVGSGNNPNTTNRAVNVPAGTTTSTAPALAALAANGLATIDDLLNTQITAA